MDTQVTIIMFLSCSFAYAFSFYLSCFSHICPPFFFVSLSPSFSFSLIVSVWLSVSCPTSHWSWWHLLLRPPYYSTTDHFMIMKRKKENEYIFLRSSYSCKENKFQFCGSPIACALWGFPLGPKKKILFSQGIFKTCNDFLPLLCFMSESPPYSFLLPPVPIPLWIILDKLQSSSVSLASATWKDSVTLLQPCDQPHQPRHPSHPGCPDQPARPHRPHLRGLS